MFKTRSTASITSGNAPMMKEEQNSYDQQQNNKPKLTEFVTSNNIASNFGTFLSKFFQTTTSKISLPGTGSNNNTSTALPIETAFYQNITGNNNNNKNDDKTNFIYVSTAPQPLNPDIVSTVISNKKRKKLFKISSMGDSEQYITRNYKNNKTNNNNNNNSNQLNNEMNPTLNISHVNNNNNNGGSNNTTRQNNKEETSPPFLPIQEILQAKLNSGSYRKRSFSNSSSNILEKNSPYQNNNNNNCNESNNDENNSSYLGYSLIHKKELLKIENRTEHLSKNLLINDIQSPNNSNNHVKFEGQSTNLNSSINNNNNKQHSSWLSRSKSFSDISSMKEEEINNDNIIKSENLANNQNNNSGEITSPLSSGLVNSNGNLSAGNTEINNGNINIIATSTTNVSTPPNNKSSPNSGNNRSPYQQATSFNEINIISTSDNLSNYTPIESPKSLLARRATSRQFWMPDDRVTHCYECQTPFSVFKRKHHCRVCGQIFCWKCATIRDIKDYGKIRVCTYCYHLIMKEESQTNNYYMNSGSLTNSGNISSSNISSNILSGGTSNGGTTTSPSVSLNNYTNNFLLDNDANTNNNNNETVLNEEDDTEDDLDEQSVAMDMASNNNDLYISTSNNNPTNDECVMITSTPTNDIVPSLISGEEFEQGFDQHLNSIEEISQLHLKSIVKQLIQQSNIDNKWEEVIVGLALKAVNCINLSKYDKMDIRNYVKIKKVLGGNMYKSEYIDGGVVFSKNLVHRKMKIDENKENLNILMLTCPISYQYHKSEQSNITNMELLISQEEEFLKLLIERIAEKKPDIIFVEKTASRYAKELLLSKGIALVVNVKRSVLERISRCTGYPILSSIDDVPNYDLQTNACCTQAYVKRIGDKTLFVVCGKQTQCASTVVFRGENSKELEHVKRIFKFALFVAYNLKLETEYFFDECGTLLEEQYITNDENILSASPNVRFPIDLNSDRQLVNNTETPNEGNVNSPYLHQNIVAIFTKHPRVEITNIENYNVANPEMVVVAYYTENDMSLGRFLELKCFNPLNVNTYINMIRMYTHDEGKIVLTVERSPHLISTSEEGIAMWNYCKICERYVTPVIPMSESSYKYSFGKFLETTIYNHTLKCRTGGCKHSIHRDHIRFFAYRDIIAKFEYRPIKVYNLSFPANKLTYNEKHQMNCYNQLIKQTMEACNNLFNDFNQMITDLNNNNNIDDCQEQQLILLKEKLKKQQSVLYSTLESVKLTVNIYSLNDFIRNVYMSAMSWNDLVIEIINTKKKSISENNNTTTAPPSNTLTVQTSFPSNSLLMSRISNRPIQVQLNVSYETNPPYINVSVTPRKVPSLSLFETILEPITPTSGFDSSNKLISPRIFDTESSNSDSNNTNRQSSTKFNLFPFKILKNTSPLLEPYNIKPIKLPSLFDNISQHLFLPPGIKDANIIVSNEEPSTIIAYTLCSKDYGQVVKISDNESIENALKSKETNHYKFTFKDSATSSGSASNNNTNNGFVTLVKNKDVVTASSTTNTSNNNNNMNNNIVNGENNNYNVPIVTSSRKSSKSKFSCTCYYANQFAALRQVYGGNDNDFVHSLARCVKWVPTGGKSGSTFTKTWDSRFILKEVSRTELVSFLEIGHYYFDYLANALFHDLPIVLVKILGVFRISYFDPKGKSIKKDVIVMDNLFYNRTISKTFDLKGSIRNRFQKTEGAVLMDENLLQFIYNGSPLITRENYKSILTMGVFNDTLFFSKHNIMDYSLLVGIDDENNELVVGIIDYIRQYTWDKHLETWVKSAGIVGSKGKIPTVISPKHYKTRFREAMSRYIIATVSKLTGLIN